MENKFIEHLLEKELDKEQPTKLGLFVDRLIEKCLKYEKADRGTALAASFDLLVGLLYYEKVKLDGWVYCPAGQPHHFFPYVNACPRCVLEGDFVYHKAGKSQSANIGGATIETLILFIRSWCDLRGNRMRVFRGKEPVDLIIVDKEKKIIFLAEVKSAPLMTLPLVVMDGSDYGREKIHQPSQLESLQDCSMGLLVPRRSLTGWRSDVFRFSTPFTGHANYFLEMTDGLLDGNTGFFEAYFAAWRSAYEAYCAKRKEERIFWLTGGCGKPHPVPNQWPKVSAGNPESISDGKTSVGLDRTDDIKKGVYQLLKLRMVPKPENYEVKVGIFSNLPAARHRLEYISPISDVVWMKVGNRKITSIADLPHDAQVYHLFDGIVTFVESISQDEWINKHFDFNG